MDPKFQTSFIPKKPMPGGGISQLRPVRKIGASLFMMIAVILFVLSLAGLVGAYLWKQYQQSETVKYQQQLAEEQKQFKIERIQELRQYNSKLVQVSTLIKNHLALSKIFPIVGAMTVEKVRFLSLDLTAPAADTPTDKADAGIIKVALKGYGTNLPAVAFQSDVLGRLADYGLENILVRPMLTDPAIVPIGAVNFSLTANVNPKSVSYAQEVSPTAEPSASGTVNQ